MRVTIPQECEFRIRGSSYPWKRNRKKSSLYAIEERLHRRTHQKPGEKRRRNSPGLPNRSLLTALKHRGRKGQGPCRNSIFQRLSFLLRARHRSAWETCRILRPTNLSK